MADKDDKAANEIKVQFHVSQELEYKYRDIFNVYVGPGEVVLELGTRHRSLPEHATIYDRVVVSIPNAYLLMQTMQQALQQAQQQIQRNLQAKKE